MIPYMVRKLAPNSSHLTRGLVKSVPGRGYFRAVPSQNGDKYVTPPPPPIVELVFVHFSINWRHTYRHARLLTPLSHPPSRKHRSCLLRSCCTSPVRPHFLRNDTNYGVNFLNTTTYVSRYCLRIARGLYPDYIIPSLPEQPQKRLEE